MSLFSANRVVNFYGITAATKLHPHDNEHKRIEREFLAKCKELGMQTRGYHTNEGAQTQATQIEARIQMAAKVYQYSPL